MLNEEDGRRMERCLCEGDRGRGWWVGGVILRVDPATVTTTQVTKGLLSPLKRGSGRSLRLFLRVSHGVLLRSISTITGILNFSGDILLERCS